MTRSIQGTGRAVIVALAFAVACGDNGPGGPLNHGIVSGQNQVVAAGAGSQASKTTLPEPVVERLTRLSTGQLQLQRVDPERLLDVLVPRAYAQGTKTVVNGSPVPGAVVCVDEASTLVPFVRCTNTDAQGHATFFFTASTKAGKHTGEIRGTVNNAAAVFDTAVATVIAGPPDPNQQWNFGPMPSPATMHPQFVGDVYQNAVPFRIVGDGRLTVLGDTVGTVAARTVTFTDALRDTVRRVVELRGANDVLVARAKYRLLINDDKTSIQWSIYGLNITP